jgi:large subunit ribosomal protein L20
MPRVRKGSARRRKHKKVLKSTRGYIGALSRRYRAAKEAAMRAGAYATADRRRKKRDFRRLWITRISAACRRRDTSYSRFIAGLVRAGVSVNRKVMADLAVSDPIAFDALVAVSEGKPIPAPKPVEEPEGEAAPSGETAAAEETDDAEAEAKPKKKPAARKADVDEGETKPARKKKAAAKKKDDDETDAKPKKKPAAKKKTAARKSKPSEKDAE